MQKGKTVFGAVFVIGASSATMAGTFSAKYGSIELNNLIVNRERLYGHQQRLVFLFKTRRLRDRCLLEIFQHRQLPPGKFDEIAYRHGVRTFYHDRRNDLMFVFDKKTKSLVRADGSEGGWLRDCIHSHTKKPERQREDFFAATRTGFFGRHEKKDFSIRPISGATRTVDEIWISTEEELKRFDVTRRDGSAAGVRDDYWGLGGFIKKSLEKAFPGARVIIEPYSVMANNVGRIPREIIGCEEGAREVYIKFSDGGPHLRFYHEQNCCEHVCVYDVIGEPQDLIGHPLVICEAPDSDDFTDEDRANGLNIPFDPNKEEDYESGTWTFYRLMNHGGSVVIRWLGTSNGYYGEGVDVSSVSTERLNELLNEKDNDE